MNKKILIGSIIAFTIIILASFSSVVGKVSLDNDLVELDVDFCGLGKKHTVQLTQQEAFEVELLFDDLKYQLDNIESGKEFRDIIKWGIIELGKIGVVKDFEMEKINNLVFGDSNNEMIHCDNAINLIDNQKEIFNSDENFNCEIVGETTNTRFYGTHPILEVFGDLINNLLEFILKIFGMDIEDFIEKLFRHPILLFITGLFFLWAIIFSVTGSHFPISFDESIIFGLSILGEGQGSHHPSVGWVNTNGSSGIINWEGSLKGQLGIMKPFLYTTAYIGATGFSGIKLSLREKSYFIGRADHVSLDTYYS